MEFSSNNGINKFGFRCWRHARRENDAGVAVAGAVIN